MLARKLEPEVVDTAEDTRAYADMDHSAANRGFVADLLRLRPRLDKTLDVCTGPAQIPILLCQATTEARAIAIDYARHMIRIAQHNVAAAGLADRVRLQRADAKRLPYAAASFSAVLCNGSLHHVPDPRQALTEMLRVTAPGGLLFIRDLMRPGDEGQIEHLLATYAADADPRQRSLFDASLRAALTVDEVRGLAEELGLYADTVQATSDRHWTLAAWA